MKRPPLLSTPIFVGITLASLLLAACGQKGPLYLPEKPAAANPAPAAAKPADDKTDKSNTKAGKTN